MKYILLILVLVFPCYSATDDFNNNGAIVGDSTQIGSFRLTEQGEGQILLNNYTGHVSKRGELAVTHLSFDNAVTTAPVNAKVPAGVVATGGVAVGSPVWVTIVGRAQFLVADTSGSVRGYWISPSETQTGRVQTFVSEPTQGTQFSTFEHDGECGHSLETKSQGTDTLFWGIVHFR